MPKRGGAGCPVSRSRRVVFSPYPVLSSLILSGPFGSSPVGGYPPECVGVVPTSGQSRQGSAAAAVPAYPAAKLLCQGSAATVAIMIPQFEVRGLSLLGQVAACPHLMPFAKGPPSSEPALASMPSFSPFAKGAVPFGSRFNLRRYQHVATTFEVIVMRRN